MEMIIAIDKIRSKYCITLESGRKYYVNHKDLSDHPLSPGSMIDTSAFLEWIIHCQYPSALNHAVKMLAARPCSCYEIEKRLSLLKYDSEVISLVIVKLDKEKLLNDIEFTNLWIQSRMKKYGPGRISQELHSKGISQKTVQSALNEITDEEQLSNAIHLARKKWEADRTLSDFSKKHQHVIAYLLRRGYSWEIAKKALAIISNAELLK